MMAELEHRSDVRAVVMTGTPPAFCVGGDSKALEGHVDRGGYDSGLPPPKPPFPAAVTGWTQTSCGSWATDCRSSLR